MANALSTVAGKSDLEAAACGKAAHIAQVENRTAVDDLLEHGPHDLAPVR